MKNKTWMEGPINQEKVIEFFNKNKNVRFDEISEEEMMKAFCTHRVKSNTVVTQNPDGTVTCPICGKTFNLIYAQEDEVLEAVNKVIDILQSDKIFYLDLPEERIEYFGIIAQLERLAQLNEIAKYNFNQYDTGHSAMVMDPRSRYYPNISNMREKLEEFEVLSSLAEEYKKHRQELKEKEEKEVLD